LQNSLTFFKNIFYIIDKHLHHTEQFEKALIKSRIWLHEYEQRTKRKKKEREKRGGSQCRSGGIHETGKTTGK